MALDKLLSNSGGSGTQRRDKCVRVRVHVRACLRVRVCVCVCVCVCAIDFHCSSPWANNALKNFLTSCDVSLSRWLAHNQPFVSKGSHDGGGVDLYAYHTQ